MQYWGITLSAQQPLVSSVCLGNNKILVSQQTLMLLALYYIHVSCLGLLLPSCFLRALPRIKWQTTPGPGCSKPD